MQAELVNVGCFADRDLKGIDQWTTWTPARTGWTDVGTPTVTGRYRIVGKKGEAQIKVVPGTTCATTAGTSYVGLPITAKGIAGHGSMTNISTLIAVGVCVVDVTNSRVYVPTQAATANTLTIWVEWEV